MKKFNQDVFRKSPCFKGFFLLLPYLFAVGAIVCAAVVLLQTLLVSPYYLMLTKVQPKPIVPSSAPVVQEEGHIPTITYGSQWASLNVEGWERRDIPVYFGDDDKLLKQGAGMRFNSRFCGQGGRTVLSAHVTSYFYEIEATPIGALVTVDTVYGKYVYRVEDTLIFHYQDNSALSPVKGEGETLFLYTCYPRKNGYLFKTQRMALICRKVEGKEFATYG